MTVDEGDRTSTAKAMSIFGVVFLLCLAAWALCGCGPARRVVAEPNSTTTLSSAPPISSLSPQIDLITAPATSNMPAIRVDPPETTTIPPSAGPEEALARWGADQALISWAMTVCHRESRCQLDAWNWNPRTKDDSGGPWQINFYGPLEASLARMGITREMVVADWDQAAGAFLVLYGVLGKCAWTAPNYCS